MVKKNEILMWLKTGGNFFGIQIDQSVESMISVLGMPKGKIGDQNVGFFEYENGLRIGYFDGEVDEIGFTFYGKQGIRIPIEVAGFGEFTEITEKTMMHEFIKILNYSRVKWESNDEGNIELFSIRTEGNVFVVFDLDTGYITRIALAR